MIDQASFEQAAALLAGQRRARARITALPEALRPRDPAEAYRIQDRVHERLTAAGLGPLAGHKIGCTTPVMQAFLAIPSPCAGGVFASTVQYGAGRFRHGDYRQVGVECEIAVRLGRDLGAADAPFDRDRVAPAVAAAMAAIEVVDDRYDNYRALGAPTLIADDFFNTGCVLGAPVSDWQRLELAALEGRMRINGNPVGEGRGGDIMGHPFEALAWLAGLFARRGLSLCAGDFVLLGSVVETKWMAPGDHVEIEIDGLGTARAEFTGDRRQL
jgi:2-oxo-3-hexenedioate decarboxylase/2-keto-4-pentenoate hydratase